MDDRRALDAATDYDATRQPTRRPIRWIHATVTGPLFDRARDARVAHDPDAEADARRDREED